MSRVENLLQSTDILAQAGAAWRWWCAELLSLVPRRIRDVILAPQRQVTIDLTTDDIVIGRIERERYAEIDRVPREELAIGGSAAAFASRHAIGKGDRIILRLPKEQVLKRSVRLPFAAGRNLRQILSLELDRKSPIDPELVWFDYRILKRDREANRLDAELLIVKRATIAENIALCRRMGLEPVAIGTVGEKTADTSFLTLPGIKVQRQARRPVTLGLAILVLALGIAAGFVAFDRREQRAAALEARLEKVRGEALAVGRLRDEIDQTSRKAEFLFRQKQAPLVSAVLVEATRLLPDGTWLFQIEFNGSEIHLHGYSPAANTLIALFDASPLFANAQFRAPLTQGPRGDLQRFDLSLDLRAKAP